MVSPLAYLFVVIREAVENNSVEEELAVPDSARKVLLLEDLVEVNAEPTIGCCISKTNVRLKSPLDKLSYI